MWSPLLKDHLPFCKTLLLRGYFILAILAVMRNSAKILYAELKAHIKKNGEPGEYLMYFLYYP